MFKATLAVFIAADTSAAALAIPVRYVHHELLVDVWIGNAGPYEFMLDTDTSPSIIDLELARRLRLPMHGSPGQGSGIGSAKIEVIPLSIPSVRVGAVRVAHMDALAMDLSGISAGLGRHLDGVLGTSFLRDRIVQIDYPCRTISFLPDAVLAPFAARFDGDGVGANNSGDQNMSNDVWIGSHRVWATFDTGDAGVSFVSAKGIADLNLQATARSGRATVTQGFGGKAPATTGTLEDVRIGQKRLGAVQTRFFPTTSEPFDINIGNGTWEHFIAVFDYQRGLLTLITPHSCAERT